MGSVDKTETQTEATQPVDAVPANTEEQSPAQASSTEEQEVYVDVEGDSEQPKKTEMTEEQLRAAWKEEKRKRKSKSKENQELLERLEKLEKGVAKTQKSVTEVTRGPKPKPTDYSNDEQFYTDLEAWNNFGKDTDDKKPEPPKKEQAFAIGEDQEYHMHSSEKALKKSLSDYDETKTRLNGVMQKAFGEPENETVILDQLASIAYDYDINPAKAFYALDKLPNVVADIQKNGADPKKLAKILRDLESKVKVRERKTIDTKPEPEINGGGPVSVVQAEVDKARKAYQESGSITDYNKLQAAKKKQKDKG